MDNINTYYTTINIDVFRTAVLVLVSKNIEEIIQDLPAIYNQLGIVKEVAAKDIKELRRIIDDEDTLALGQCIQLNNNSKDVILLFYYDTIADVTEETIVHETHHASSFICDSRGIKDEECAAYVQEYLVNQLFDKIDDWNDEHKKEEE